eukprot:jgi/Mesvir1/14937/Mv26265-RA.1
MTSKRPLTQRSLADALGHENPSAAQAAASPSGPAGSGDTSRALVVAQQPPGLNASPSASPDPKRTRSADKTGGSSRPSEPRFLPKPFQVDDHDWTNMSPDDAMHCIFFGDYASLYDLCLHLHDLDRLLCSNGSRWNNISMLFGCPRPQLQRAILNSPLQRSDGEIWAPSISAPALRSILTEAFQQYVTPLAADVAEQWVARWLLNFLTFPPPPPPPPLPFLPPLPTSKPSSSTSTNAFKPPPPPLRACMTPPASPPRR